MALLTSQGASVQQDRLCRPATNQQPQEGARATSRKYVHAQTDRVSSCGEERSGDRRHHHAHAPRGQDVTARALLPGVTELPEVAEQYPPPARRAFPCTLTPRHWRPWGIQKLVLAADLRVFCVCHAAALYSLISPWRIRRRLNRWMGRSAGGGWGGWDGRPPVQGAVWTVLVVMRELLREYHS